MLKGEAYVDNNMVSEAEESDNLPDVGNLPDDAILNLDESQEGSVPSSLNNPKSSQKKITSFLPGGTNKDITYVTYHMVKELRSSMGEIDSNGAQSIS